MSTVQEIHVSDIGTMFKVTIYDGSSVVDLSTATSISLIFKKPSRTRVTKVGTFFSNGKDGIVKYTTVSGDLDVPGTWQLQAQVIFAGGQWWSNIVDFTVYPNL